MHRHLVLNFLILVLVLSGSSAALTAAEKSDPKKDEKLSRGDATFVKEVAEGGMVEVELGKIAATKATRDQVKAFGRQMEEDHGKANEELKAIAAKKGIDLPKNLQGKHQRTIDRLSKLSGMEFDRQYMRLMVEDHKENLQKFQRQADKGKDPEVKQFANKQVPVLNKHFEMAQAADREVKEGSKGVTKEPSGSKETKEGGR